MLDTTAKPAAKPAATTADDTSKIASGGEIDVANHRRPTAFSWSSMPSS